MRIDYYDYIQSPRWRDKANAAKKKAGYRCQVCNKPASQIILDAHHRTYERLGNERPEDITVLCRDCHSLYEERRKSGVLASSPKTIEYNGAGLDKHVEGTDQAVDRNSDESYPENEGITQGVNSRFLPNMGKATYTLGYIGNGLYLLWIEFGILFDNPLQIINPFMQLQSFWRWITSPLFWQFAFITVTGLLLYTGGNWITEKVAPKTSTFRWYWKWSASALIRVPLFVWVVYQTFVALLLFGALLLDIVQGNMNGNAFVLPSNVLAMNALMLVIPVFHLVWDNRINSKWVKFGISIIAFVLLVGLNLTIEYWWLDQMCFYNLLDDSRCSF